MSIDIEVVVTHSITQFVHISPNPMPIKISFRKSYRIVSYAFWKSIFRMATLCLLFLYYQTTSLTIRASSRICLCLTKADYDSPIRFGSTLESLFAKILEIILYKHPIILMGRKSLTSTAPSTFGIKVIHVRLISLGSVPE